MRTEYRLIQIVKTYNGLETQIVIGQAFNICGLDRLRELAIKYSGADGELKLFKIITEEIEI